MGKRSQPTDPVCQVMTRDTDGTATVAVYGPDRGMVWLCVHSTTPTVIRLWPLVVRFLLDTLDDLTNPANTTMQWRLPWSNLHPELVVMRVPGGDPWLYIFAASPNAIQLTRKRLVFLRETLTELPAMAPERVDRSLSTLPDAPTAKS